MQQASTHHRLMRKLGMGSSKPGPARSVNVYVRPFKILTHSIDTCCDCSGTPQCGQVCDTYAVGLHLGKKISEEEQIHCVAMQSSLVSPMRRHGRPAAELSSGNGQKEHSSLGLRLTECEIDLTPSRIPFFHRTLGVAQRAAAAGDACAASLSSQALKMTDNRFSSQPAFEARLRAAPRKDKAPPAGTEQSRTPLLGSEPQRAASQQQQAGQSTSHVPQVHATKVVGSQASNGGAAGLPLSTAKKQVSPQPKQLSLPRTKAYDAPCKGARDEPAKRVKYDHLLGGNALLSLAGRGRHSRR